MRGAGPCVLVMTEMPGITPAVAAFARKIADAGFTVWMPQLFGTPGRGLSAAAFASSLVAVCVSREFALLSSNRASPMTDRLRALGREGWARCGCPGIGAIGMCITGNFALTLALDPHVLAPVLCQPSLPFGVTKGQRAGIHAAPDTMARLAERGQPVVCVRFSHDKLVPQARIDTLRAGLGACLADHCIDSGPGNPHRISGKSHSALTADLVDVQGHPTKAALDAVMSFFRERLR